MNFIGISNKTFAASYLINVISSQISLISPRQITDFNGIIMDMQRKYGLCVTIIVSPKLFKHMDIQFVHIQNKPTVLFCFHDRVSDLFN